MKQLVQKILVTIAIIFSFLNITALTTTSSAYADSPSGLGSCRDFLGMTSWDCGIYPNPQDDKQIGENIRIIVFNVFVDIGILATYLVVAYVVYGGYLYMFSSGDPGKAMTGKKTLTRAFIGLAIVMLANIILSTIRTVLIGNQKFEDCNPLTSTGCADATVLAEQVINWFIGVAGLVAVIFVIVGGIGYMTSRGDPGKLQKAKSTILYSLIGLIIVALSWAISTFVYNILRDNSDFEKYDANGTSLVQNTTVAKNSINH